MNNMKVDIRINSPQGSQFQTLEYTQEMLDKYNQNIEAMIEAELTPRFAWEVI